MREEEVKEKLSKEIMKAFDKFIQGQTIGKNPDGSFDFYKSDVDKFVYMFRRRML